MISPLSHSTIVLILALLLTLPNTLSCPLFKPSPIIPPLYSSIQIRRTLVVRIRQHGNDTHQNLLHTQDRSPPLLGRFMGVLSIFPRIMQNGDAHLPIFINVWMPHFRLEGHFWWLVWKIFGEDEACLEEAALV